MYLTFIRTTFVPRLREEAGHAAR